MPPSNSPPPSPPTPPPNFFCDVEKVFVKWVRKGTHNRRWGLVLSWICLACLGFAVPLFLANTWSFQEAHDFCEQRRHGLIDSLSTVRALQWLEIRAKLEQPALTLLPLHYLNATTTFVSMLHSIAWLHLSPHRNGRSKTLDRKRKNACILSVRSLP